eukprot:215538-Chlamydomonas_euryale.AAC.1
MCGTRHPAPGHEATGLGPSVRHRRRWRARAAWESGRLRRAQGERVLRRALGERGCIVAQNNPAAPFRAGRLHRRRAGPTAAPRTRRHAAPAPEAARVKAATGEGGRSSSALPPITSRAMPPGVL